MLCHADDEALDDYRMESRKKKTGLFSPVLRT